MCSSSPAALPNALAARCPPPSVPPSHPRRRNMGHERDAEARSSPIRKRIPPHSPHPPPEDRARRSTSAGAARRGPPAPPPHPPHPHPHPHSIPPTPTPHARPTPHAPAGSAAGERFFFFPNTRHARAHALPAGLGTGYPHAPPPRPSLASSPWSAGWRRSCPDGPPCERQQPPPPPPCRGWCRV